MLPITRFGEEGQTKAKTLISNNEDGTFMDKLRPYLDDVEECYFAGGEILVQPEHYECMDYWIENGLADKVKLNYTTNMSKISHKNKGVKRDLIELWNNFPNVEIWASIDAIDKQGELIRKGFNWDKVKENMLTIKDKAPHVKVGVTLQLVFGTYLITVKCLTGCMIMDLLAEKHTACKCINLSRLC